MFNSQHGKWLPFTQRQGHNGQDLELQHQYYSVRQEMGYITKTDSQVISCEYTNNRTNIDVNRIDFQDNTDSDTLCVMLLRQYKYYNCNK